MIKLSSVADQPFAGDIALQPAASFAPALFSSVTPDEIAFALSLFFAAANHQIGFDQHPRTLGDASMLECARVFSAMQPVSLLSHGYTLAPNESQRTLEASFLILWTHYEADPRQAAICARVLGFYHLMECSKGAVVEQWIATASEAPEAVMLPPAIIQAVATFPITEEGMLPETQFTAHVHSIVEACAG